MKTRFISFVALMLMTFAATAGNKPDQATDDTLKVYRLNFSSKIERLTFSGYCNVEVVSDTVEYLECFDRTGNASTMPKGVTYGYRSRHGKFSHFSLEAIPGVGKMRLHLLMGAHTTIYAEDYAQIDVVCPAKLTIMNVYTEDYSRVTIHALQDIDTIRARRLKLMAEDFSSVSVTTPCFADDFMFKATDFSKVDVAYCFGTNMRTVEEDRAKVNVPHFNVTNTVFSGEYEDVVDWEDDTEETPSKVRELIEERKESANWHSDDFRLDFLWGFLNWGDKPYNGLMRMDGGYALNTTFSSYQLEAVYYPFVNSHWHLGIGLGYTSDVFKFVDPYVCVAPDAAGVTTFSNSVNYGLAPGSEMSSRLVARYVTLPIMVRWEPSSHSDFFIGLAAIPGLNYNNSHTGMKHRCDNGDEVRTWRDNTTNVMNPFRLDARLSIGLPNIYAYLQMATVPLNTGMDKEVYPIKLGIAISLGEDD